jgi:hypothetical protein
VLSQWYSIRSSVTMYAGSTAEPEPGVPVYGKVHSGISGISPAWVDSVFTVRPPSMLRVFNTTLNSVFISRSMRSRSTGFA